MSLIYTNFERVAQMCGKPLAQELDRQGLIRHDNWQARKPTHYVLKVRIGKGPFYAGNWLRQEVQDVLHTAMGATTHWWYGGKPVTSVELTYLRKGSAEIQARNAIQCGLEAEVVPCVLIPVNKVF